MAKIFVNKLPYEDFKIGPGKARPKAYFNDQKPFKWPPKGWFGFWKAKKGSFAPKNWEQRSIAKISYAPNIYPGQWRVQGRYLARQGAQFENTPGLGFDDQDDALNISKVLNLWQESGDPRLWKVILSPEMAHKLNLKDHVRAVMGQVEKDLGVKLEWAAIDHHNTDNPHAHIVIRGIGRDSKELRIKREYLKQGFRLRSQQEATRVLGFRLKEDIIFIRQKYIKALHITELDREIERRLNRNHFIHLLADPKSAFVYEKELQLKGRLMFLEGLGQAKRDSSVSWHVEPGFLGCLKYIQTKNDIIKAKRIESLSAESVKIVEELKHAQQLENKPRGPRLRLTLRKEDKNYGDPRTN